MNKRRLIISWRLTPNCPPKVSQLLQPGSESWWRVLVSRRKDRKSTGGGTNPKQRRRFWRRNCAGTIGGSIAGRVIGNADRREDLAEQAGEFAPLTILAAAAHGECERFKSSEGGDFGFEFADGARRRRLIEDLLLGSFDLVIWRILKVLQVLGYRAQALRRR